MNDSSELKVFTGKKLKDRTQRMSRQCKKRFAVMHILFSLCVLIFAVTAQNFKPFDDKNAFRVFAAKEVSSHDEARAKCKALNSDLAVIKSPKVLEFVIKLIKESGYVETIGSAFRIGLKKVDGQIKWVDGADVEDQSMWLLPPEYLKQHCGAISNIRGSSSWTEKMALFFINCTDLNTNYICHKQAGFTLIGLFIFLLLAYFLYRIILRKIKESARLSKFFRIEPVLPSAKLKKPVAPSRDFSKPSTTVSKSTRESSDQNGDVDQKQSLNQKENSDLQINLQVQTQSISVQVHTPEAEEEPEAHQPDVDINVSEKSDPDQYVLLRI